MSPLLEIKDLKVTFETENGPFHAVDDVSFSIASNETVCIVGESGSGKSITSLSVMGLLPDNGTVTNGSLNFQGKSLLEKTEEEMQKLRGNDISMIFQEPMTALNPVLKIGYQLSEPLFIHKKISKKEVRKKSIELLDKVGIPEPAEKLNMFPHELSGGMRQRVMIAMALAGEPSLLIADEPTTALDVTIQAQILELLEDLKKQFNMGVLFVTHDMGVVAEIADRVIVMNNGKVVESGTVDAIFNRPVHPYTKKLLGAVPDVDQPKEGPARLYNDQSDVLLEAKNLSKYYPVKTSLFQKKKEPVKAVKNISFEI